MPKFKNRPPKYCRDGRYAAVYIGGKRIRIGIYDSPESRKEYNRIISESKSNPAFSLQREKDVTLDEVAIAYLDYAERQFGKGSHYDNYRTALKFATDLYGHRPVTEFSPLKLRTVRDEMIRTKGKDWCRKSINRSVDRIRTALSWEFQWNCWNPGSLIICAKSSRCRRERPVHSTTKNAALFP